MAPTGNNSTLRCGLLILTFPFPQEENQYLANSVEVIKSKNYTPEQLRMMGYGTSEPYLGWVDLQDPMKVVMGVDEAKHNLGGAF